MGAENWAIVASLIETCKLSSLDPLAWMTDALTKLVNLWPVSRIAELMPRGVRQADNGRQSRLPKLAYGRHGPLRSPASRRQ